MLSVFPWPSLISKREKHAASPASPSTTFHRSHIIKAVHVLAFSEAKVYGSGKCIFQQHVTQVSFRKASRDSSARPDRATANRLLSKSGETASVQMFKSVLRTSKIHNIFKDKKSDQAFHKCHQTTWKRTRMPHSN